MDTTNILRRACAFLSSLQKNLDFKSDIEAKYALEYNDYLEKIETGLSLDLSEFKVSPEEMKPVPTSWAGWMYEGDAVKATYSKESYVDGLYLRTRLDSVLAFFYLEAGNQKIGFNY